MLDKSLLSDSEKTLAKLLTGKEIRRIRLETKLGTAYAVSALCTRANISRELGYEVVKVVQD